MAEKNLIDVQLENLVFAEVGFDLEGEQRFIDFSDIGFFGRQVEVAGNLLCDGRCPLFLAAAQNVLD